MTQSGGLNWIRQKWGDFESFVEGVLMIDLSISARLFGLFLNPFSSFFTGLFGPDYFSIPKDCFFVPPDLDALVIVVGNLTMGGTGKTPVVERLARELVAKGRKVAVLSRLQE